jgi:hypothetical protein
VFVLVFVGFVIVKFIYISTVIISDIEVFEMTERCVICGKEIIGYGNNAEPVAKGRCCDVCNITVVIPERLRLIKQRVEKYG